MFPLRDLDDNVGDVAQRGRREQKRLDTRAALNEAAVALFASQGYEHTTVDDLCREANVSLRTFFRYFEGKDDVLFAREMDIAPFLDAIRAVSPDVPALEAFRRAYLVQPRLECSRCRPGGPVPARHGQQRGAPGPLRRGHGVLPR